MYVRLCRAHCGSAGGGGGAAGVDVCGWHLLPMRSSLRWWWWIERVRKLGDCRSSGRLEYGYRSTGTRSSVQAHPITRKPVFRYFHSLDSAFYYREIWDNRAMCYVVQNSLLWKRDEKHSEKRGAQPFRETCKRQKTPDLVTGRQL